MGVKRNTYGPKLKRYKEENNLSYRDISEATGINPAMLCGWANGKVNPNANSEKKIAEFIKKRMVSNIFTARSGQRERINVR